MAEITNKEFIILTKSKDLIFYIDDILENVPRKDMYYKDYSYADISKVVGRTKDAINIRCLKLYGSRHKKCKSKLKEVLVND